MNKQEVIEQIRAARAKTLAAIEGLPPDAMLRPGAVGIWSVKDALVHITVWQSELVTALSRLDSPKLVPHIVEIEDLDEFNQEQYSINVRRPVESVMEDFHGVHKHLIRAVESLSDKVLNNARLFPWMEGEPISYLIAENGFWHETEHAEQIAEWRKAQGL